MIPLSVSVPHPTITVVECRLRFSRSLLTSEASRVRGFFGQVYADEDDLHHHNPDGSLRYQYPRVQFKVLDRSACLMEFGQGGEVVTRVWSEVDRARLGAE